MNLKLKAVVSLTTALASSQVFAAGYEKSIMWGGRTAGVAGIATPYIQGSQALFFNPAGLVMDQEGSDATFNITAISSKSSAPISAATNAVVDSENGLSTPAALLWAKTLNDKLGIGFGYFASAGSNVEYKNVTVAGGSARINTDLAVTEFSVGAGYKVLPNLKLGVAWRLAMVNANFSSYASSSNAVASYSDLSDTDYGSFRLGAQYTLMEKTHIGLSYRSNVNFAAEGKQDIFSVTGPQVGARRDVTLATSLPQQISLGVKHDLSEKWNLLAEYNWTEYSFIRRINIQDNTTKAVTGLNQNWADQHNIRLAGEYMGYMMPVRFGYMYTSTVSDENTARPGFTPPGPAHTLTVGSGNKFMGDKLMLDYAFDYTMVSGDGVGGGAGVAGEIRTGEYTLNAYALHLGVTYAY